jgi:tetratricopeptide (TPR) repeat protein
MNKRALLIAWMLMITISCPAQSQGTFVGYGTLPVKTPDSLLRQLKDAAGIKEKMRAAKPLLAFHASHGTTDSVIFYAQQLIPAVNESPDKATLYNILAKAYQDKGLFEEALRFYLEGIKITETLGDTAAFNDNKLGIANVYFSRNEYNKAITLYNELLTTTRDEQIKHTVYRQLSQIYLEQKELTKAQGYAEKALFYFRQSGQLKNELQAKLTLGIIAELNQHTDTAFSIYNEVISSAQQNQFFDIYINAGQRLGDLLIAKQDYENARGLLTMVYANTMQWNDMKAQLKVLNSLRNLHAAMSDYKNAYALMTQLMGISREVLDKQNKREINEL